ncbi:hypothetical protein WME98_27490 [Sorangium sp. So ce296]|uniref:hypothetical protein n=1 Tax=Sorangium sp. So ce296 TaxID=3133296 RepID=UPI003F64848C
MATLHGPEGPAGDYPERAYLPGPEEVYVMPRAKAAALAAAPAGVVALLWAGSRLARLAAERRRARRGRWLQAAGAAAVALAAMGLLGRRKPGLIAVGRPGALR